jgi:hypothetical protein
MCRDQALERVLAAGATREQLVLAAGATREQLEAIEIWAHPRPGASAERAPWPPAQVAPTEITGDNDWSCDAEVRSALIAF